MKLNNSRKTAKEFIILSFETFKLLVADKRLAVKIFPVFTVSFWVYSSRKMAKILFVSRKGHHPIETLHQ